MPIDVAHMSDLHFCPKNLEESSRTFGFAVSDAIQRKVRAAVITGDSTDHPLEAHEPSLRELARHLKRLADHCPVLMLQGTFSHEPPGLLKIFEMIGARHTIAVADRIGMFGLDEEGFAPYDEARKYELVITAFPTVNKADLVASAGATNAAHDMGEVLFNLMRHFGQINRQLTAKGIPTMLIGHGTVQDCETEHGVPMAGVDHEFGVGALFSANCDAVALGHIHKHQVWNKGSQILAYAGSIGRFHHGEEGDKHYLVWAMEASNTAFTPVKTPARKTVDIFFEGVPDMQVILDSVRNCVGAYVRIRYCVDKESRQLVNRDAIKAILAEACHVQIEGKTLVVERQRAAGISTLGSISEKLKSWCDVTKSPFIPLLERIEDLQTLAPAEIAAKFMRDLENEKITESFDDRDAGICTGIGCDATGACLPAIQAVAPGRSEPGRSARESENDELEWLHEQDGLLA